MIKPFHLHIRIIAGILVITFLCQDILWANPDAFTPSSANLQIQTISKGIFNGQPDPRDLIAARMVEICTLEDRSNIFYLVKELKRRKLRLPSVERDISLLFDFSRAKYSIFSKEWRVPCSASSSQGSSSRYTAYIGPEGLREVVRAGSKRSHAVAVRPVISSPVEKPKSPTILEAAEMNIKNASEIMELGDLFVDRRLPQEKGFLSHMLDRFIPRNILLDPKRVTTVKFTALVQGEDGRLEEKVFYGFRVLQNDARGAGKGGLRWLVVKGETLEEAKATAIGLATLMSIKNGVVGIPYGGGKGDIVVDGDYDDKPDDKARIMRGFARALTEVDAIGTFIDVPAPDKKTNSTMMAWFLDEHLRVLTEKGTIRDKRILSALRDVRPAGSYPQMVPYLAEYACILDSDSEGLLEGLELGVITGKPVWSDDLGFRKDRISGYPVWKGEMGYENGKTIRVGGSEGREKATGYGGFLALKAMLKYLPSMISTDGLTMAKDLNPAVKALLQKDPSEMTVGVQGTGNVGEFDIWQLYHAGSRIKLLQDVHWTLFDPNGINIEEMNKPENLPRRNNQWVFDNLQQGFLDRTGSRIVEYKDESAVLYKEDGIDVKAFLAELDLYLPKDANGNRPQFDSLDESRQAEFLQRTGTVKRDLSIFWTEHTNIKVAAATENVIDEFTASRVNCEIILELANNPTAPKADAILRSRGMLIIPDVLANVGGVTVSYFEWLQNIEGRYWHETSVDKMLEERIYREIQDVIDIAKRYDTDLRSASFILALARTADAEIARSWKLRAILTLKKIFTGKDPYKYYGELSHDPDTVEELSQAYRAGKFTALIYRNEARRQAEMDGYVEDISRRFDKSRRGFVLVSGPRTSGKMAFSDQIRKGMEGRGFNAVHLDIDVELDHYAKYHTATFGAASEDRLYEIKMLRLRNMLNDILAGREIGIRKYENGAVAEASFSLKEGQVLVLEGDYALSDEVKELLQGEQTFRAFVNTAPSMKLGDNWPLTSLDIRFIRHILTFAGVLKVQSPIDVIREWPRIREHDLAYVYKTWKNADVTFNSYLSYELPALKPYIMPLLMGALDDARRDGDERSEGAIEHLLLMLKDVPSVSMDGSIPSDSILRQFIGEGDTDPAYYAKGETRSGEGTGLNGPQEGPGLLSRKVRVGILSALILSAAIIFGIEPIRVPLIAFYNMAMASYPYITNAVVMPLVFGVIGNIIAQTIIEGNTHRIVRRTSWITSFIFVSTWFLTYFFRVNAPAVCSSPLGQAMWLNAIFGTVFIILWVFWSEIGKKNDFKFFQSAREFFKILTTGMHDKKNHEFAMGAFGFAEKDVHLPFLKRHMAKIWVPVKLFPFVFMLLVTNTVWNVAQTANIYFLPGNEVLLTAVENIIWGSILSVIMGAKKSAAAHPADRTRDRKTGAAHIYIVVSLAAVALAVVIGPILLHYTPLWYGALHQAPTSLDMAIGLTAGISPFFVGGGLKKMDGDDAPPIRNKADRELVRVFFSDRERIKVKYWSGTSRALRVWFVRNAARKRGRENQLFRINSNDLLDRCDFVMSEGGRVKRVNRSLISLQIFYQLSIGGRDTASVEGSIEELKKDLRINKKRCLSLDEAKAEFYASEYTRSDFWGLTDKKTRIWFVNELARLRSTGKMMASPGSLTLSDFGASVFDINGKSNKKSLEALVDFYIKEHFKNTGKRIRGKEAVQVLKRNLGIKDMIDMGSDIKRLSVETGLGIREIEDIYTHEVSAQAMRTLTRDLRIAELAMVGKTHDEIAKDREVIRLSPKATLTSGRIQQVLKKVVTTVHDFVLEEETPDTASLARKRSKTSIRRDRRVGAINIPLMFFVAIAGIVVLAAKAGDGWALSAMVIGLWAGAFVIGWARDAHGLPAPADTSAHGISGDSIPPNLQFLPKHLVEHPHLLRLLLAVHACKIVRNEVVNSQEIIDILDPKKHCGELGWAVSARDVAAFSDVEFGNRVTVVRRFIFSYTDHDSDRYKDFIDNYFPKMKRHLSSNPDVVIDILKAVVAHHHKRELEIARKRTAAAEVAKKPQLVIVHYFVHYTRIIIRFVRSGKINTGFFILSISQFMLGAIIIISLSHFLSLPEAGIGLAIAGGLRPIGGSPRDDYVAPADRSENQGLGSDGRRREPFVKLVRHEEGDGDKPSEGTPAQQERPGHVRGEETILTGTMPMPVHPMRMNSEALGRRSLNKALDRLKALVKNRFDTLAGLVIFFALYYLSPDAQSSDINAFAIMPFFVTGELVSKAHVLPSWVPDGRTVMDRMRKLAERVSAYRSLNEFARENNIPTSTLYSITDAEGFRHLFHRITEKTVFTVTRDTKQQAVGGFTYQGIEAYINYLENCGVTGIKSLDMKIKGQVLDITASRKTEDGSVKVQKCHSIRLDKKLFPEGIIAGSRSRRAVLDVLAEQGAPIMIPIAPNGVFCANGWEYYVAPLFKELGVPVTGAVCYAYRGKSEKNKRIDIYMQERSLAPRGKPLQTVPLSKTGVPYNTSHIKTTRGGSRMLLYVLPYLVERGLISGVEKARGLDKVEIKVSDITRYTRVRIGNFSYLRMDVYLNYLNRCGLKDIAAIRFEITGKKLSISVSPSTKDGNTAEPRVVHTINLTDGLKPADAGDLDRSELSLMMVLERSGVPIQIYVNPEGKSRIFIFRGVAYHIASFLRRLDIRGEEIMVVFCGGKKDGDKRLEIRKKGEPMDFDTPKVTTIDLDEDYFPIGVTEAKPDDGTSLHVDILELQLKRKKDVSEKWPESVTYKKRSVNTELQDQVGFNGIVYQGLQRYIKYLKNACGMDIRGVALDATRDGFVDIYAVFADPGKAGTEKKLTHSIKLGKDGVPLLCDSVAARIPTYSLMEVLEQQNNPLRVGYINPDQFTIGSRPAMPVSIYGITRYLSFLFPEYKREEISIFKLFGNDNIEPSVVFVLGNDYDEGRILTYKGKPVRLNIDDARSPEGFRSDRNAQRVEISEIMHSQGAIDNETYNSYIEYKSGYDKAMALNGGAKPRPRGNLESQLTCLLASLPDGKKELAATVEKEIDDSGFISETTIKAIIGAFQYSYVSDFESDGTWPIYYLLRDSARKHGLLKENNKIFSENPTVDEVRAEFGKIPPSEQWRKNMRNHHPTVYKWMMHYPELRELLPSRRGRSRAAFEGDGVPKTAKPKEARRRTERPAKTVERRQVSRDAGPVSDDNIPPVHAEHPKKTVGHVMGEDELLNSSKLTWLDEVIFGFLQDDSMSYITPGYGQRIKDLRRRASIRQPELAGRVRVKDPVSGKPVQLRIYRLFEIEEEEGYLPTIDEVSGIARALNVSERYILRGEDPPDLDKYEVPAPGESTVSAASIDDILNAPLDELFLEGLDDIELEGFPAPVSPTKTPEPVNPPEIEEKKVPTVVLTQKDASKKKEVVVPHKEAPELSASKVDLKGHEFSEEDLRTMREDSFVPMGHGVEEIDRVVNASRYGEYGSSYIVGAGSRSGRRAGYVEEDTEVGEANPVKTARPNVESLHVVLKPIKTADVGGVGAGHASTANDYETYIMRFVKVFKENYEKDRTGAFEATVGDEEEAIKFFNGLTAEEARDISTKLARRLNRDRLTDVSNAAYNWAVIAAFCCMPEISIPAYKAASEFTWLYNAPMFENIFKHSPYAVCDQFSALYKNKEEGWGSNKRTYIVKKPDGKYYYLSGSIITNSNGGSPSAGQDSIGNKTTKPGFADGIKRTANLGVVHIYVLAGLGILALSVIILPFLLNVVCPLFSGLSFSMPHDMIPYSVPFVFIGAMAASGKAGAQDADPLSQAWELYMKGYHLLDDPNGLDGAIESLAQARTVIAGPYRRFEKAASGDAAILYLCILGNLGVALLRKGDSSDGQDKYYYEASMALEEGYRVMRRFVERRENMKVKPGEPLIASAIAKMYPDMPMIADNILTRLGQSYIGLHKYEKAMEMFNYLLVMYPRSWTALVGVAASNLGLMRYQEAKEFFLKALEVAEDDLNKAEEDLRSVEGEDATQIARDTLMEYRERLAKTLINIGNVSSLMGERDMAERYYARCEEELLRDRHPVFLCAYYEHFVSSRADNYGIHGDVDRGIADIERALAELEDESVIFGRKDFAKASLKGSLADLYLYYKPDGLHKAIEVMEREREISGEGYPADLASKLGELYLISGDADKAIEMLKGARARGQQDSDVAITLAMNYCRRNLPGDLETAESLANDASSNDKSIIADSEYIKGLADLLRANGMQEGKDKNRALRDARAHMTKCKEANFEQVYYYYVSALIQYMLGDKGGAARSLKEFMSVENHKFPRKFLYAFDVIGIGGLEMRTILEEISHDEAAPGYVRDYTGKILSALPDIAPEQETAESSTEEGTAIGNKEQGKTTGVEAEKESEIAGLLDKTSALKDLAKLYYLSGHIDSQVTMLETALANCKTVISRNDLSNKRTLASYHGRAKDLSRDIDNILKRMKGSSQLAKRTIESALVSYVNGDFMKANDSLAELCRADSEVRGAFQFRKAAKDSRDGMEAFNNKKWDEALDFAGRIKSGNQDFRARYELGDFAPQWMEDTEAFADGMITISAWLSDCDKAMASGAGFKDLLADERLKNTEALISEGGRFVFAQDVVVDYKQRMEYGIQNYLITLAMEGGVKKALIAVRDREDVTSDDFKAVRRRIRELFIKAMAIFEEHVERGDLNGAKNSLLVLQNYRSLGKTDNAATNIDSAEIMVSIWERLQGSDILGNFKNPITFIKAVAAYQQERLDIASMMLHLLEYETEDGKSMIKRMSRNIDRMEGFREVLASDDGWSGAESHAKRVEALDFIAGSLGADYLYLRAQIELHEWLGVYNEHKEDSEQARAEYEESLQLIESDPVMINIYKNTAEKLRKSIQELSAEDEGDSVEEPEAAEPDEVQPMTRSKSELGIEDAKAALGKMRIDDRYGCTYSIDEDGSLKFTPKTDNPQARAFAKLLNSAAYRLKINVLALSGPVKNEVMEAIAGLRSHQATAPPEIGVAKNCPFTSVRRSSDGLVLFDAEMIELLITIMNDEKYSNYKIHYDHVIDWLISERLFHEVFHASREKEQTIRDIHYYYLLLNTAGMRNDVKEFFDSPLVKDSKIAQKTKIRFKFIERQARRLMRGKPIDIKKVSRFLGPYKEPIGTVTDVFERGATLQAYKGRDIAKEDELVRGFLEALFSNALQKKTVLAFSDSLGKENGRPLRILETVKELKRDPLLGHLFKNVEIVTCPAQNMHNKIQKYFGDPNTQVFTFVNTEEEPLVKGLKNKNPVRLFYINDAQLDSQLLDKDAKIYYPLLEVVTISLLDHRKEGTAESIPDSIRQAVGIESIQRKGDSLVFVLTLPKSERHDIEKTVAERYARLQKLLRFA